MNIGKKSGGGPQTPPLSITIVLDPILHMHTEKKSYQNIQ